MLALAAAGIAVVVVIVKLVPVTAITTWMFGGDVVNEKGNIEMVDWRKVRAKVQMTKRMRQRHSRRPWRSMWFLYGFLCKIRTRWIAVEVAQMLSRSGLVWSSGAGASRESVRVASREFLYLHE